MCRRCKEPDRRGNARTRRRRRAWLLGVDNGWAAEAHYRARGTHLLLNPWGGDGVKVQCWNYAECGLLLNEQNLEVDRALPGWLGGDYSPDNVRPSCGGCNRSRNRGNPWTLRSQRCLTG